MKIIKRGLLTQLVYLYIYRAQNKNINISLSDDAFFSRVWTLIIKFEFKELDIGYIRSPPFRNLNDEEKNLIINDINKSGIKFFSKRFKS